MIIFSEERSNLRVNREILNILFSKYSLYFLLSCLCSGIVLAATKQEENIHFSGYLDGSYNYLVNSNRFISGVFNRLYDLEENGLTLQQAAFTVEKLPENGFGGLLNIIAGRDANTLASFGWNPYFGSQTAAMDLTQIYLQYAVDKFIFTVGKFVSLAGEEGPDPVSDTNFSRSILFGYLEPSTVMGLRGTYQLNEELKFIAGLNNGWDNIRDTSRRKTYELGVDYKPNTKFTLASIFYSGGQRAQDRTATGPESIRNLLDVIATFNVTEKATVIFDYDYADQTNLIA